ncbi:MAG: T9SS type A sorting domain-containing protein [Flavobacteriales bacterium]|nr:T9SS type A sorting domain-containing protein [Flavobacteriales bacterium]
MGYDANGNAQWALSPVGNKDEVFLGVCQDVSGGVWVTGYYLSPTLLFGSYVLYTSDTNTNWRTHLARLAGLSTGVQPAPIEQASFMAWPSPGDGLFWMDLPDVACERPMLEVFDAKGQAIRASLNLQQGMPMIDLRNQADGIYLVRVQCGAEQFSTRVMKASGVN